MKGKANLTLGIAVVGTLLSGCGRETENGKMDHPNCVPYTTSEYQRRQDAIVRAANAKQRYDAMVSEQSQAEAQLRAGDTRFRNFVPGYPREVQRLKADLIRANSELDQVNNEPPLCPSPNAAAAPAWPPPAPAPAAQETKLNLAQIYGEYEENVRACPIDDTATLLGGGGLLNPQHDRRSAQCEMTVMERYQRQYPSLSFGRVD